MTEEDAAAERSAQKRERWKPPLRDAQAPEDLTTQERQGFVQRYLADAVAVARRTIPAKGANTSRETTSEQVPPQQQAERVATPVEAPLAPERIAPPEPVAKTAPDPEPSVVSPEPTAEVVSLVDVTPEPAAQAEPESAVPERAVQPEPEPVPEPVVQSEAESALEPILQAETASSSPQPDALLEAQVAAPPEPAALPEPVTAETEVVDQQTAVEPAEEEPRSARELPIHQWVNAGAGHEPDPDWPQELVRAGLERSRRARHHDPDESYF